MNWLKNRSIEVNESLDEHYVKRKEEFELPATIGIGETGLVFQYGQFKGLARNAYFTIPYHQLSHLIKPDSLLNKLIH